MLAFIHVAKTGGRSVTTALRSSFGAAFCNATNWHPANEEFVVPKYSSDDFRRLKGLCPFMRAVGGHPITLWSNVHEVQPVRYFAYVREPIRRAASHFQFQMRDEQQPLSWQDWLAWPVHHNHQVKMFARDGKADTAIRAIREHNVFVGLTERFDESLLILKKLVEPKFNPAYVRVNTARDNEIAHKLLDDEQARDRLAETYAEEFALFRFVSEEWYPQWRERYGPTLDDDVAHFQANRQHGLNRRNILLNRLYRKFWLTPHTRRYRRQHESPES